MGGAALGGVLFASGGDSIRASGADRRAASPAPPPCPRARPPPVPAPRLDTLPWTVQLAACARADKALALADRLASREHLLAFVTPVALEGRRGGGAAVWYRVLAGAFTTRDSAVLARAALWANPVGPKGRGGLLRAPDSLSLAPTGRPDRLRPRGSPALAGGADGP